MLRKIAPPSPNRLKRNGGGIPLHPHTRSRENWDPQIFLPLSLGRTAKMGREKNESLSRSPPFFRVSQGSRIIHPRRGPRVGFLPFLPIVLLSPLTPSIHLGGSGQVSRLSCILDVPNAIQSNSPNSTAKGGPLPCS